MNSDLSSSAVIEGIFHLEANPNRGPLRPGKPWYESTLGFCAITCLNRYLNNCMSLMYNTNTGLCTPGSVLGDQTFIPSDSEGALYHRYCDSSKGFQVITTGTTKACVAKFRRLKYTEADAACQSKGAFLMSVKTTDKLSILLMLAEDKPTWVGCDDLTQIGTYRWKEDGEILTDETISEVFLKGDPNYRVGEDCVCLAGVKGRLVDYNCSVPYNYVCEIDIP